MEVGAKQASSQTATLEPPLRMLYQALGDGTVRRAREADRLRAPGPLG